MGKIALALSAVLLVVSAEASWYWPFGSDTNEPPRLAELLEPASTNIDAAADLLADGRTVEALSKYRQALAELDRVERLDPERTSAEFASVRTKRAYVLAAVDAIETQRARSNARSVVATDTTELELAMKMSKRLVAAGEKADRECERVRTRGLSPVTNRIHTVDAGGRLKERIVISNLVVVVTNAVASTNALAQYGRIVAEIDALAAEREDRLSQPYYAGLAALRDHAAARSDELAKGETKVAEENDGVKEEQPRKKIGDARPEMTDQREEARTKAKSYVADANARAEASRKARESREKIEAAIKDDPDGRPAKLLRAGQALRERNYADAQREIDALLKKNAHDASALNLLAAMAAVQKNFDEAERRYLKVIEAEPDDYHAYYNLARLRLGPLNDREGAKQAYADGRRFAGGPKDKKLEERLK